MPRPPKPAPGFVDFVCRSFRDVADKDYLAARVLYRYELEPQFLWAGSQAIEKYLKAILLFNGRSAKRIGHDIDKALQAVDAISDLALDLPVDVREFVAHLARQGPNRYFDRPLETHGDELAQLDRSVWYIRR